MRITLALVLFATLVGCGGNVAESSNNTGGGGSGPSNGTSGTVIGSGEGGTASTLGMGGRVGAAGGLVVPSDGGASVIVVNPGSCAVTNDHASFRVTTASDTQSCETTGPDAGIAPMMVTGAVTAVTPTSFAIDRCAPNADCLPSLVTFEVKAP